MALHVRVHVRSIIAIVHVAMGRKVAPLHSGPYTDGHIHTVYHVRVSADDTVTLTYLVYPNTHCLPLVRVSVDTDILVHPQTAIHTHPVRVSVDDTVTLTSHRWPYTHRYPLSEYSWMTELLLTFLVHTRMAKHTLPTPLSEYLWMTQVTLTSLVHPRMAKHILPTPCRSICG